MKRITRNLLCILSLFMVACSNSDDLKGPSQFDTTVGELSELDQFLRDQFVDPYNIEIQYKWDINEVSQSRILYPPHTENVKPLAEALLKVWAAPYNEVGGEDFIKKIAPRQFTFVGSYNYNQSATILLGLAEAGTKISFFNIDFINYHNLEDVRRPMHTVQHEYVHILNQNKPYNPDFDKVNPGNYTAQWFNRTNQEANELGYITNYASSQASEDFAEMASVMLTTSKDDFDSLVNGINSSSAREAIREKEKLVKEYYRTEYNIDFDELCDVAYQNLLDIIEQ